MVKFKIGDWYLFERHPERHLGFIVFEIINVGKTEITYKTIYANRFSNNGRAGFDVKSAMFECSEPFDKSNLNLYKVLYG